MNNKGAVDPEHMVSITSPSEAQCAHPEHLSKGCCNHVCSIVPPHILIAITNSDAAHPEARAAAERTLMHTQGLRDTRHTISANLAAPATSAPPQSIIPSNVLGGVASSEDVDPETREGAQRSLAISDDLRSQREGHAESLLARKPVPPPTTAENRLIYTANNGTSLPGTLQRSEGKPETSDVSINECYDGLGDMYDFIGTVFNRQSIDDMGMDLIGTVHYDKKFNNAFWDGQQMVFGDGDGIIFNRFTGSVDVIGHELTHGITSYTANLLYSGQSGALNESISDCFGSMLKQYHLKQTSADADWLIGQGLFTDKINAIALRSMKAPGTAYDDPALGGKDSQPDNMKGFVVTSADSGGVHTNSGIPNRAFYLVAYGLGGYSWERAGQIWYTTLRDPRLKRNASFKLFADLTCDNALKSFDQSAKDVVTDAWTTVGVYAATAVGTVREYFYA
jgi:Zn-dependent metalloprotease